MSWGPNSTPKKQNYPDDSSKSLRSSDSRSQMSSSGAKSKKPALSKTEKTKQRKKKSKLISDWKDKLLQG